MFLSHRPLQTLHLFQKFLACFFFSDIADDFQLVLSMAVTKDCCAFLQVVHVNIFFRSPSFADFTAQVKKFVDILCFISQ